MHTCLTLCMLGNFHDFFYLSAYIFSNLFPKILSGLPSVSKSLGPDQARFLSVWILVQTVCKGYQQTTLLDKELKWAWFLER